MITLHPAFADPVRDSQAVFRAVMDATAHPGRVGRVAAPAEPPPPLGRAAAALLLCLVDGETTLWLDPAAAAAVDWIAFHCGAAPAGAADAQFALGLGNLPFHALTAGSDEAPEAGATAILQLASLERGAPLRLTGPGIDGETTLHVDGLPPGFGAFWAENNDRFPRGIDLILCAGDALAALPRTTRIR